MNAFQGAFRLMYKAISHPATQRLLKHALRIATAEAVRYVQRNTRGRSTRIHYS